MLTSNINDFRYYFDDMNIFFDRGLPGLLCYETLREEDSRWEELLYEVNTAVRKYRYNKKVFIFPSWKEIYINDEERTYSFKKAEEIYTLINKYYAGEGYDLLEVPKTTVEKRVEFIIHKIDST